MDPGFLGFAVCILAFCGGIAGIVGAAGWAKGERLRAAGKDVNQVNAAPAQDAVLAEVKALQQQVADMQSTGHQFDISFDAALERLEGRVNRLETKSIAAATPAMRRDGEPVQNLHNGATP